MKPKIIVIDPDRRMLKQIKNILSTQYETLTVASINESYSFLTGDPIIIIIDPLYPKKDGLAFIKNYRKTSDMPIIAVSENGSEKAVTSIIEAGADDYIRKPFFSEEFIARIGTCVRHLEALEAAKGAFTKNVFSIGNLRIELDSHTVFLKNTRIHLTKNEFKVLSLLCRNSGKVLTYDFIIKTLWGARADNNTGILRVNITNLRKKIEENPLNPKYIHTENGIGYRLG